MGATSLWRPFPVLSSRPRRRGVHPRHIDPADHVMCGRIEQGLEGGTHAGSTVDGRRRLESLKCRMCDWKNLNH